MRSLMTATSLNFIIERIFSIIRTRKRHSSKNTTGIWFLLRLGKIGCRWRNFLLESRVKNLPEKRLIDPSTGLASMAQEDSAMDGFSRDSRARVESILTRT